MSESKISDFDERSASSLDPEDWQDFRAQAHKALDQAIDYLELARERPVWQATPPKVKEVFSAPVPLQGRKIERVIEDVQSHIMPYATGNTHPGFCGWVHGGGTAGGVVSEMLAAAVNANCGGRDHAPIYVERQVLSWFKEIFGFPPQGSGLLTSGTSMATLIALTIARDAKAGWDTRREGVAAGAARLLCYASKEAHGSVAKALELVGLGTNALRSVAIDSERRLLVDDLHRQIEADLAAGHRPFCVVGTAGTVNSGAIDDLDAIASLCREFGLWFHVDGAFGALAQLTPHVRHRLQGIDRADSLAFDFHKWLQVPYDAGCLLVRNEAAHLASFGGRQPYLRVGTRGLAAGAPWFCEYGPELSRGFRALKIWVTMHEHGLEKLGAMVAKHCEIAKVLAIQIAGEPELELLAPQSLNIVCFRYADSALPHDCLDSINLDIVETLQENGMAAPSTCMIDRSLAIRACFCNHRTTLGDAVNLLEAVLQLGRVQRDDRAETQAGNKEFPVPMPTIVSPADTAAPIGNHIS